MSTDNTDSAALFDEISSLILSDTFITWFNTTNELVDAVNPIRIYDVIGGTGIKESRSGGTVTLSIDDGPGIKGTDNLATGEKQFTLDFHELPTVDNTDGVANPDDTDIYCVEVAPDDGTDGTFGGTLKKVTADSILSPTVKGEHTFTGKIFFTDAVQLDIGYLVLTGESSESRLGLEVDLSNTEETVNKTWLYDYDFDAWISNVAVGVCSSGFVTDYTAGGDEATFVFNALADSQEDIVLEFRVGDAHGHATALQKDSWYIAARHSGSKPHTMEFALQDYEVLGSDDAGYNVIMSLERDDTTATTTHVARFHDKVIFENIETNSQFSNTPNGNANTVPLTSSDGFLTDSWFNRRSETNFDSTGPDGLAIGMAVTYIFDEDSTDGSGKLVPAQANSITRANVVGIVESIVAGKVIFNARGDFDNVYSTDLIAGQLYYLDPDVAGGVTPNIPTESFHCIRPVFVATSKTGGVVNVENWGREIDVTPRSSAGRIVICTPNFETAFGKNVRAGDVVRFLRDEEAVDNINTDDTGLFNTDQTDIFDTDSTASPSADGLSTDGDDPVRNWESVKLVRASASDFTSSLAIGVVESIKTYEGVPHAVVVIRGEINTGLANRHGNLVAGGLYFLDDNTSNSGGVTTTPPEDVGTVTKVVMHGMGPDSAFVDIESSNKINGFFKTNTITIGNWEDTTANPMTVGDVVRLEYVNDTDITDQIVRAVKAKADTPENSQAIGVVARIITGTSNILQISTFGEEDGFTGLEEGAVYYLSASSAGGVTTTKPTGGNTVVRPIGKASSETTMVLNIGSIEDESVSSNDLEQFRTSNFDTVNTIDVGDWVRYDKAGTTKLYKADAFALENSMVIGVVTEKYTEKPSGVSYINVATKGHISNLYANGPLTAGFTYYLAASPDSGTLTDTLPVQGNSVRKRCFIATSTTGGYIDIGDSLVMDSTERTVIVEDNYTSDLAVGDWVRYETFVPASDGTAEATDLPSDGTDRECRFVGTDGKLFYDTASDWSEDDGFLNHPDLGDIWNNVSTDDGATDVQPHGITDEFSCPCEAIEYVHQITEAAVANGAIGLDADVLIQRLLYVPNANLDSYEFPDGWQNSGFTLQDYETKCGCDSDFSCPDDICERNSFTVTVATGVKDHNVEFHHHTDVHTDGTEHGEFSTHDHTDEVGNIYRIDGVDTKDIQVGRNRTYIIYTNFLPAHQFKLSTTEDGVHNGGVEYTKGVRFVGDDEDPRASFIDWDVSPDAPSTLYYYCPHHPKMGGKISITDLCTAERQYQRLTKAIAALSSTNPNTGRSHVVGMVESFHNNRAVVVTHGRTMPIYNELLPGALYYLNPSDSGNITRTRPTNPFHIIKPCLIATTHQRGVVNITSNYELGLKETDYYYFANASQIDVGDVVAHAGNTLVQAVGDTGFDEAYYNPVGVCVGKQLWDGATYLFSVRTSGLVTGVNLTTVGTGQPLYLTTNTNNAGSYQTGKTNVPGKVAVKVATVASATSMVVQVGPPEVITTTEAVTFTYDTSVAQLRNMILTGSTIQQQNRGLTATQVPFTVLTKQNGTKLTIEDGTFNLVKGTIQAISSDGSVAWVGNFINNQNYDIATQVFHDSEEPNRALDPDVKANTDDSDMLEDTGIEKLWMINSTSPGVGPWSVGQQNNLRVRRTNLSVQQETTTGFGDTDNRTNIQIFLNLTMNSNVDYRQETGQNTDGTDVDDSLLFDNDSSDFTGDAYLDIVVIGEDAHNYNYVANIEVTSVRKPKDTELTDLDTEGFLGWFPCGTGQGNSTDLTDADSDGCPDSFCTTSALGWCVVDAGGDNNIIGGADGNIECPDCMALNGIFVLKDADIAPSISCIQVDTDGTVTLDCPTGTD
tara:strand:- start:5015 stop:10597 length:5583 start_codon:yes stop_codon:yes gene_type:complete